MRKLEKYLPLFMLLAVSALAATALTFNSEVFEGSWMSFFMGFALCQFSLLKLFQLKNFVAAFRMYDILAMRSSVYAYCYPLIELVLGLSFLAHTYEMLTYGLTFIILGFGVVGVIRALQKGLDVKCACMGTTLDVPLSTVTLFEDLFMAFMALILFVRLI